MGEQDGGRDLKKTNRWVKASIIAGTLFVVYLLVGFFLAPWILHTQLEKQLKEKTGREVTVESVRMNPLTLSATINGFRLFAEGAASSADSTNGESQQDLLQFRSLHVDVSSSSIWRFAPVIETVRLDGPYLNVARRADGTLSFDDILEHLAEQEPDEPTEELPRFLVHHFELSDGYVRVVDEAVEPAVVLESTTINFVLRELGTLKRDGSEAALKAELADGAYIGWSGTVELEPFTSTGTIEVSRLKIGSFQAYAAPYYNVGIEGSELSITLPYALNSDAEELLSVEGAEVRLRNLTAVVPETSEPFFFLDDLHISGISAFLTARSARIEYIGFKDGVLQVERTPDGQISLLKPLGEIPTETDADSVAGDAEQPTFNFSLGSIIGENFQVNYRDHTFSPALSYPFKLIRFSTGEITSDFSQPFTIRMEGAFDGDGSLVLDGEVRLDPLVGKLDIQLSELPLAPLSSVAATFTNVQALVGTIGAEGTAAVRISESGELVATYLGGFRADSLALAEDISAKPIVQVSSVTLEGVEATSQPLGANVAAFNIAAPQATIVRLENGEINLIKLLQKDGDNDALAAVPDQQETDAPEESSELPIDLKIEMIQVRGGDFRIEDVSVNPRMSQRVHNVNATVENFALSGGQPVRAELEATLADGAQMRAQGSWLAGDFESRTVLSASLQSMGLPPFSPYSATFIGRGLSSGALSFDVSYQVDQSRLNGDQTVRIANLSFGPRIEGASGTNLPIDLAVSLMKDRNGVISLDVPISGDINNPEFSFAKVIQSAIGNIITKAVTAPFSMIGSLFGGGGQGDAPQGKELSYIAFIAGDASVPDSQLTKIETLARALYERPQLSLVILANRASQEDYDVLLRQQLRAELGQLVISSESQLDLSNPADYQKAVAVAYDLQQGAAQVGVPSLSEPNVRPLEVSPDPGKSAVTESQLSPVSRHFRRGRRAALGSYASSSTSPSVESNAVSVEPIAATTSDDGTIALPPTFEEMEAALLSQITVPDQVLTDLQMARVAAVRDILLATQPVEPTRVQITDAPAVQAKEETPVGAVVFEITVAN